MALRLRAVSRPLAGAGAWWPTAALRLCLWSGLLLRGEPFCIAFGPAFVEDPVGLGAGGPGVRVARVPGPAGGESVEMDLAAGRLGEGRWRRLWLVMVVAV